MGGAAPLFSQEELSCRRKSGVLAILLGFVRWSVHPKFAHHAETLPGRTSPFKELALIERYRESDLLPLRGGRESDAYVGLWIRELVNVMPRLHLL